MNKVRSRTLAAACACAALTATACEQTPFTLNDNTPDHTSARAVASSIEFTGTIRIGVVPTATSVTIGADGP